MCPVCEGTGRVSAIDIDALVDRDLSLNEGAITVPNFTTNTWYWRLFADSGFLDPDKKLRDYTERGVGGLPPQAVDQGQARGASTRPTRASSSR